MSEIRKLSSIDKTNHDMADKVNESLPVHLSSQDVKQNPEFMKLLITLTQHVRHDGTSTGHYKDMQQAKESMLQAKSQWLQNDILYAELQELLLDHQLHVAQSSSNNQFYEAVQECVTYAELGDYLHCNPDPSSTLTLLGLKKEDCERKNPHRKHLQSIQQKLIPEIETRLRKKCEALVNFHEPLNEDGGGDNKLAFAKATQLPSRLEEQKRGVEEESRRLRQDKHRRDKQFYHYYQALMDSLHTLEQLIQRHRLHSQSENDTITSEWLAARCDAMCLKIRMLELQLLCDTYYADTVQALARIKHELDDAVKTTQKEIAHVSQALNAYDAVGMGFETIVKEYTYLRDEVENKRWALRELKHSLQKE